MTLPKGWITRRFDRFGNVLSGSTPATTTRSYWDGSIVWVTPNDLSKLDTPYLHDSAKRITEEGLRACSATLVRRGSIVISSRAPIGYVAIPTVAFCTNQGCKTIALRPGFDSEYAYYNITFNIGKLKHLGEGTTFAEISKTALTRVELPFPSNKVEQSKIAEVLSTVDRAIEQTQGLIAKQQRIKTGLMQDLLTRGIDENGNLRSEETHEFKDSPLGRIPVEWKIRTLNDCVPASAPICYGILMPGRSHDGGVPVIKVKNIIGGHIVQDDILLTDHRIDNQYRRSRLMAGDILLTIRGTTGRVAIVPPELDGANITQDTARVRLNEGSSNQFFYFLLQSFRLQDQIQLHTLGQAVKGINIGEVKRLFFGLPEEPEQAEIAMRLAMVQKAIDDLDIELLKQRSLKAGLMQDLLTGKVRVTPLLAEQEVAT